MADLILSGRTATLDEAEELYLDGNIAEVVRLVEGRAFPARRPGPRS